MQISRLFEITHLLLNKKRLTATELAKHFEVSTRTIYRDVEALSAAGIPIYMSRGKGGGIELLPNYVLSNSLLSTSEQLNILSALQSVSAVQNQESDALLEKLGAAFGESGQTKWIEIDYSDWSNQKKEQFETVKHAVIYRESLSFLYHNRDGASHLRTVDPLRLWFKDKTWYLKAFCHYKQSVRLFKLNRMKNLSVLGHFKPHLELNEAALETPSYQKSSEDTIVVWFHPSQAYRVYDEFEDHWVQKNEDDSFTVTMKFVIDEWVVGYLLSFGPYAKVLSPTSLQNTVKHALKDAFKLYAQ